MSKQFGLLLRELSDQADRLRVTADELVTSLERAPQLTPQAAPAEKPAPSRQRNRGRKQSRRAPR